jgi:alginate O-acetyltransferase complex protein AlgI
VVFSSVVFLLYFLPVLLVVYHFANRKFKNLILLVFSIFFYSWGAPKFIFVILATTFVDFHLVNLMWKSSKRFQRRMLLTLSACMNLGLLFYFKYSNFFIENLNVLFTHIGMGSIHWVKLLLPIGISFYTFETITYVVDVYRGIHKPLDKFWDYQLYIILFPKLIAGPIIRYHELADQIPDRRASETYDNILTGFYRFAIGLGKKVLIANQMGQMADSIFNSNYLHLSSSSAWIGILAYTFQIYFDFSGYSDMAIGLGRMFGFKFPENFNNPYISKSITEFWRRWHITLGNWMRNYLYIPLGGNRVNSKARLYFNLWLVFLASGLWHGASWSFVFWGAYHGFFLVMERIFLSKVYLRIGSLLSNIITFFWVVIGWVFFRVEKLGDAFIYLRKMFSFQFTHISISAEFLTFFCLAIFFAFFAFSATGRRIQDNVYFNKYSLSRHLVMTLSGLLLFILSLSAISSEGFNPFIYFRF